MLELCLRPSDTQSEQDWLRAPNPMAMSTLAKSGGSGIWSSCSPTAILSPIIAQDLIGRLGHPRPQPRGAASAQGADADERAVGQRAQRHHGQGRSTHCARHRRGGARRGRVGPVPRPNRSMARFNDVPVLHQGVNTINCSDPDWNDTVRGASRRHSWSRRTEFSFRQLKTPTVGCSGFPLTRRHLHVTLSCTSGRESGARRRGKRRRTHGTLVQRRVGLTAWGRRHPRH